MMSLLGDISSFFLFLLLTFLLTIPSTQLDRSACQSQLSNSSLTSTFFDFSMPFFAVHSFNLMNSISLSKLLIIKSSVTVSCLGNGGMPSINPPVASVVHCTLSSLCRPMLYSNTCGSIRLFCWWAVIPYGELLLISRPTCFISPTLAWYDRA